MFRKTLLIFSVFGVCVFGGSLAFSQTSTDQALDAKDISTMFQKYRNQGQKADSSTPKVSSPTDKREPRRRRRFTGLAGRSKVLGEIGISPAPFVRKAPDKQTKKKKRPRFVRLPYHGLPGAYYSSSKIDIGPVKSNR